MSRHRLLIRWASFILFVVFAGPIVASVFGEFFIELAREKGWYANPSQRLDAGITAISTFLTQTWVLVVFGTLGGFTLSVWLDFLLRGDKSEIEDDRVRHLNIHLQKSYAGTGLLDSYRASLEFLTNAEDVRICLDYRVRAQDQKGMGEWTRVTLLSKDFVAKGEWIHKQIFSIQANGRLRTMVIESSNDLDGKKRTVQQDSIMECVVIIFCKIDGEERDFREPFLVMHPFFPIRAWPEITTNVKLTFRGLD